MTNVVETLKKRFSTVERLDLNGNTYQSILSLLDKCSKEQLVELKNSNIKFVSLLAANRLNRSTFWN